MWAEDKTMLYSYYSRDLPSFCEGQLPSRLPSGEGARVSAQAEIHFTTDAENLTTISPHCALHVSMPAMVAADTPLPTVLSPHHTSR